LPVIEFQGVSSDRLRRELAQREPMIHDGDHHVGMAIDDYAFNAEDVKSRLHGLFDAAKTVDEFEFGCTLLRVRGMESAGWDPFGETHQLVEDLMTLVGTPLMPHTKVRLGLLLYSHLSETGAAYDILANFTRVVAGQRYVIDPFLDHYPRNRKGEPQFLTTPAKVRAVKEMLSAVDHAAVSETLDWFFHASVRNAFAHADYTLHSDEFRARSEFFERRGLRTPTLPLDVLADIVNRALAFYDTFMREHDDQRGGYRANKVVGGRIGGGANYEPVELLADEQRGLYGFRSPPGEPEPADSPGVA
jgi:hypothetical protein